MPKNKFKENQRIATNNLNMITLLIIVLDLSLINHYINPEMMGDLLSEKSNNKEHNWVDSSV